jgi:hypothetical protein
MATLETNCRNAMADAIDTLVDSGSGTPYLAFETSGDVEVAKCLMTTPNPFGAAASGVITADTISDDESAAGGTVAQVSMYMGTDVKVAEFTCGTGAEEFVISSTSIGAGDTVGVSSFTITVPAS